MHKLPQPVKLWYVRARSSATRRPQAGRFRQFTQIDAEALGSDDPSLDAELILLLAELHRARRGGRRRGCALSSLGTPETRAAYLEELRAYLREHEAELSEEVRGAARPEPAARVRRRPRGHAARGGRRAEAARPPRRRRTPSTSRAVLALLDAAGRAYEVDPTLVRGLDYYTRTVFEFESERAGRAGRARRRRPLRRAGRAARRPADAGGGLGRRRRAHPAGAPTAEDPGGARRRVRGARRAEARADAFRLAAAPARRRPAGGDGAGRPLA